MEGIKNWNSILNKQSMASYTYNPSTVWGSKSRRHTEFKAGPGYKAEVRCQLRIHTETPLINKQFKIAVWWLQRCLIGETAFPVTSTMEHMQQCFQYRQNKIPQVWGKPQKLFSCSSGSCKSKMKAQEGVSSPQASPGGMQRAPCSWHGLVMEHVHLWDSYSLFPPLPLLSVLRAYISRGAKLSL